MIKTITVTNYVGDSIVLELAAPEKSGLSVRSIEGIGPAKATINVSEIATIDGAIFNGTRVASRNITMTLGMFRCAVCPTIEASRHLVYKYFPVRQKIKMEFLTDERSCYTYGYVESNEPDIFSNDETCSISIICTDPYFYRSGDGERLVFSGISPEFEFPFENNSLTENHLCMSDIKNDKVLSFEYPGDADVGMVIQFLNKGIASGIAFYNVRTKESLSIDTASLSSTIGITYQAGDIIEVSTVKGNKYVHLIRNGISINIINALSRSSDWPIVRKGINEFAYYAESGIDDLELTLIFDSAFEGV